VTIRGASLKSRGTIAGVIAKVGDHASRQKLAQRCCGKSNGLAATAFQEPAHDVTAQHSPKIP
jgi:hypothetical protein